MRHFIVFAIAAIALSAFQATASDGSTMSLNLKDGSSTTIALSTISRVTVENGNVVVTSTDASTSSTAISTINNITFTADNSGTTGVEVTDGAYEGIVEVFAVDGRLVKVQQVDSGEVVDLDNLEDGVYIIKAGSKATKIRKQ